MGYRMEYEGYQREDIPQKNGNTARVALTVLFSVICILLVMTCWQEGRDLLLKLVIPGEPAQTIQAACVFAQELQDGAPILEAAAVFCESVLGGEAIR